MKTKKGFTLIEIIICIALLSVLGVSSVFIATNTSKNNELENLTKKVLEAANVYIETEKDKHGNTYSYGIDNGGKGVTIPLNTLVNKGYVQNEDANKIKSLVNYSEDKDYYILLAETNDLCDSGVPFTKASWEIGDEEIYLCDYNEPEGGSCGTPDGGENKDFITELLDNYGGSNYINAQKKLDKITNQNYQYVFFHSAPVAETTYEPYFAKITPTENGLFYKNDGTYYYRGNIQNNYINIEGFLFRIINFKEDEIRLIYEKEIDTYDWLRLKITELDITKNSESGLTYDIESLKDELNTWFNNFAGFFIAAKSGSGNFFIKTDYCNAVVEEKKLDSPSNHYVYEYELTANSENCTNTYEAYVGLLSLEEANYAGIAKNTRMYLNITAGSGSSQTRCGEMSHGITKDNWWQSNYVENISYLLDGGSLLTSIINKYYGNPDCSVNRDPNNVKYGLYYIFNQEKNEPTSGKIDNIDWSIDWMYSTYIKGSIRITPKIISEYVRPVITINPNEIKSFTGTGTKDNPYILIPKSPS